MQDLSTWNYEESVKTMKVMVMKWSTMTVEMVSGLYKARQELAARGVGKIDVTNDTSNTWTGYCKEIGLDRMTAHRWLERYEPIENKLITVEELETRKAQDAKRAQFEAQTERQKQSARIDGYVKTGCKPVNWTEQEEKIYQDELAYKKRNADFMKEVEKREREEEQKKAESKRKLDDIDEMIKKMQSNDYTQAVNRVMESATKRMTFKESIRVSHEGLSDPFVDAIMDYLETLADDNRRVEACYNIIKVCKGIVNGLQTIK